ncbi:MAG TPA: cytochrome P450 [Pseudonocardiaceae bacterium]|jgi:cytochrome P450|nr:cytochrome P450 [Pseudonocardiaceae bacterium]
MTTSGVIDVSPKVPEVDLADPDVLRDPVAAYGKAREQAPLARLSAPGFGEMWGVTRYAEAREMLTDARFELNTDSYQRPNVPADCEPFLRTMQETEGAEHLRLRRLVSPAFTARRAAEFRPRVEPIVARLLDELPDHAENGSVDLVRHFARPLPIEVICELVGIPARDRPKWREYGAAVAAGYGKALTDAIPGIVDGAKSAVATRRVEPSDDVISSLIQAQSDDGDRLGDTELISLVWLLVLSGQTPTNLIANSVAELSAHPEQLVAFREDDRRAPRAVEELIRWCGPQLLAIPRYAKEAVRIGDVRIDRGEAVSAVIAAATRDPRAFPDPDRLDITRDAEGTPHLGFGHGPHFCLGAALARVQTGTALTALLNRFPKLTVETENTRTQDPSTWRLAALPARLRA